MFRKTLGIICVTVPAAMFAVIVSVILGWFQAFVFFGSIGAIACAIGMFLHGISLLSSGNPKE